MGNIAMAGAGMVIDAYTAHKANKANARESFLDRKWKERMSSTAHRREVTDLKGAGLNPILSAQKGASSPPGSMPVHKAITSNTASNAMQAAKNMAEIANIEANTDLVKNKTATTDPMAEVAQSLTDLIQSFKSNGKTIMNDPDRDIGGFIQSLFPGNTSENKQRKQQHGEYIKSIPSKMKKWNDKYTPMRYTPKTFKKGETNSKIRNKNRKRKLKRNK